MFNDNNNDNDNENLHLNLNHKNNDIRIMGRISKNNNKQRKRKCNHESEFKETTKKVLQVLNASEQNRLLKYKNLNWLFN